jgi:hypothetical protein
MINFLPQENAPHQVPDKAKTKYQKLSDEMRKEVLDRLLV